MLRHACVFAGAVMLLVSGLQSASGQDRQGADEQLRVRRLTGIGQRARAATPFFQTSVGSGVERAQDWHVVFATYDTAPEWIDDLLVQFFVLSAKPDPETRQNVYSLYKKTVRYGDVERGRDHRADVFLRPEALKRFGDVVACAAVFTLNGKVVAEPEEKSATLPESWWRNPLVIDSPALKVREGYLLNRAESPWAMINPDDYEVIK
jgi:hypothetical protein